MFSHFSRVYFFFFVGDQYCMGICFLGTQIFIQIHDMTVQTFGDGETEPEVLCTYKTL